MNYDIVPLKSRYRGMGRLLLATDLYTKQSKSKYNFLLDMYYKYLSDLQYCPTKEGLNNLIVFCNELAKFEIKCEVIVYDTNPIENAFEYALDFLGIDIVHDMSESLLCESLHNEVIPFLNENGLCNSKADMNFIIPLLDHGDATWEPCYVYKVVGMDNQTNQGTVLLC